MFQFIIQTFRLQIYIFDFNSLEELLSLHIRKGTGCKRNFPEFKKFPQISLITAEK